MRRGFGRQRNAAQSDPTGDPELDDTSLDVRTARNAGWDFGAWSFAPHVDWLFFEA
jgi:hypothetical protein